MKIIQHGDPEKLKRLAETKTFMCGMCGCIFEADWSEYEEARAGRRKSIIYCVCPECGLIAHEKEADDA